MFIRVGENLSTDIKGPMFIGVSENTSIHIKGPMFIKHIHTH